MRVRLLYTRLGHSLVQVASVALFLFILSPLVAREYRLYFGNEDNWQAFPVRNNVQLQRGYRGQLDVRLAEQRYATSEATDLYLSFDEGLPAATTNYRVIADNVVIAQEARAGRSGYFANNGGLLLSATASALLGSAGEWGDFSIEFYSYGTQWAEYEQLLYWRSKNSVTNNRTRLQEITLVVVEERLQWNFVNFFTLEDQVLERLTLHAADRLAPRRWYHHLLRYNRAQGLLEYLVDGQPQAVRYTTESGEERGALYTHLHGEEIGSTFKIAPRFSGLLDELRIVREWIDPPPLRTYSSKSGTIASDIIDLSRNRGALQRIEAQFQTPDQSEVKIEYRFSTTRSDLIGSNGTAWVAAPLDQDIIPAPNGRFLQLRARLLPDGIGAQSPRLSSIEVVIERPAPLLAPRNPLVILPEQALAWEPPPDLRPLAYRVYYGPRPGYYPYRLEAGAQRRIQLPPLEPDSSYYFVIESYLSDWPTLPGGRSAPVYLRTDPVAQE